MWLARLKVRRDSGVVGRATGRLDALGASYYLNTYRRGRESLVTKVMFLGGKDKELLFQVMLGHKKLRIRSREGDQVVYEHLATDTFHAQMLDGSVFIVGPVVARQGVEHWQVGSWKKAHLLRLVRRLKRVKGVRASLEGVHEGALDFFLPNTFAALSRGERSALLQAVAAGYYDFPRRRNLEQLARDNGVHESTLREQLRKAEGKVLAAAAKQAFLPESI